MRRLAFLLTLLISVSVLAEPTKGPTRNSTGSVGIITGGTMEGPLAWCVISQTADDAQPSVGAIDGCATDTGGNILETSSTNSGPLAITDLDSPLVGMTITIVGTGGANPSTIADGGNFNLEGAWSGITDQSLILYVQADNDYVELGRKNGARFFDGAITAPSIESSGASLKLQLAQVQDLDIWSTIASGNPSINIYGWNTAGGDRESVELTMDDVNDEFLLRAPNSANHEGITVAFQEASQLFRVRGSDGAVDFSSSDTALLGVNALTLNSTLDLESYMALGNGSTLDATLALLIDYDQSTVDTASSLKVLSQITATGGTGNLVGVLVAPEAMILNDAGPGVHPLIASMEIDEPAITETVGTVTNAVSLYVKDAPTEGGTNWAVHVDAGNVQLDGDLNVDGAATLGSATLAGDLDIADFDIQNPQQMYREAPIADAAATDMFIMGENAADIATGGNQTAANITVASGIRTLVLVCADRTVTDTDEIDFTVNGVLTQLVESTHYDCEGTASEEVCCDNLGVAITTAVATIKMVPDCDTTAGTCYLTPDDDDVRTVESITIADGGVNGVGVTLTEGVDGDVEFKSGDMLMTLTPDMVQIGGTTSATAGLKNSGTSMGIRLNDDSGWGGLFAATILSNGDVRANAASKFHWNGRSEFYSSADGKNHITDNATTGYTSFTFGPETANFPGFWTDGAGGVTLGAGNAAATAMKLTTTGRRVIVPGSQELSVGETLVITSSEMELYSDGGALTSTADPSITNGSANGEIVCLLGTSDANRIEWVDESVNAGGTLELDGDVAFDMGINDTLCLRWVTATSKWVEKSRSDNDDD